MGSACTPSMREELTPELMMTERSCMKVAGRSSGQNLLMPSGKRSTRNGPRGYQRNFPSGSVRGPAKRLVMLRPQKVRKKVVKTQPQKKKTMTKKKKKRRRRKKRRRSKYILKIS